MEKPKSITGNEELIGSNVSLHGIGNTTIMVTTEMTVEEAIIDETAADVTTPPAPLEYITPESVTTQLEIFCIGAGDALSTNFNDSSFLIRRIERSGEETTVENILFDCGTTTYKLLHRQFGHIKLDGVVLTHNHADHSGSLEQLAFFHMINFKEKLKVYVGSDEVSKLLWDNTLSGGMACFGKKEIFFDFKSDAAPQMFDAFTWIKNDHVGHDYPCYGFAFRVGEFVAWISGDTKFNLDRFRLCYEIYIPTKLGTSPSFILHEAAFYDIQNPVHSLYGTMASSIPKKVKKNMLLYHYDDNIESYKEQIKKDGFMGYALEGVGEKKALVLHQENDRLHQTFINHSHSKKVKS